MHDNDAPTPVHPQFWLLMLGAIAVFALFVLALWFTGWRGADVPRDPGRPAHELDARP